MSPSTGQSEGLLFSDSIFSGVRNIDLIAIGDFRILHAMAVDTMLTLIASLRAFSLAYCVPVSG